VKLAQVALFLAGLLDEKFVDGLLCDETVTALQTYNEEFGPFEEEVWF
jgi:hypothetical protein